MPSAGSLTPNFGTDGVVINDFTTSDISINTIIQPDGNIITVGIAFGDGLKQLVVTRHNPDGNLDASFGDNGIAIADLSDISPSGSVQGYLPIMLSDDGITVLFEYSDTTGFGLVRFNDSGNLDSNFGNNGVVTYQYPSDSSYNFSPLDHDWPVVQPDGKIIVGSRSATSFDQDFSLIRFNRDGTLDSSFGTNGVVTADFEYDDTISNIILQPNGKILVYGTNGSLSDKVFIIGRYNSDGSIDTNFGDNGFIFQDGDSSAGEILYERVFLQPDDKIIAFDILVTSTIIRRYNPDGSIDSEFGADGLASINANVFLDAIQVTFESDGQILILAGTSKDLTLYRYNSDGSIDTGFGNGGNIVVDIGPNDAAGFSDSYDEVYGDYGYYGGGLHLDEQGRILVSGYSDVFSGNSSNSYFITRYFSDGSLDTSFGNNGVIETDLFNNTNSISTVTFSLQPNGNILLSGSTQTDPNNPNSLDFAMLSYLAEYANAAPQDLVLQVDIISINQSPYLLSGSFDNLEESDAHTVVVDWGDGSTTNLDLAAGDADFGDVEHIYTDPGSYTINVQVTDSEGLTASVTQQIQIGNSQVPDFGRDGSPDIVWRNGSTGQNSIWYLDNNNTRLEGGAIEAVSNTDWHIEAVGDFDGDGQDDLLWRNGVNGRNTVWFMDERTRTSTSPINSVSSANWQIQGVGTFEAGSTLRNDIVWRNQKTGANVIWIMEGTNRNGTIDIQDVSDTNWEIGGVGDFDGDDQLDDVVWHNSETGQNVVWFVNPDGTKQSQALNPLDDPNWQIEGVSDFDGDGFADDLLWRNSTLGRTSVWFIDDGVRTGTAPITPAVPDGSWSPVV